VAWRCDTAEISASFDEATILWYPVKGNKKLPAGINILWKIYIPVLGATGFPGLSTLLFLRAKDARWLAV
jgi:hypothetical protein